SRVPPMPVIGILDSRSPGMAADTLLAAFRQGLAQTGFVESRNVAIEYHFAGPQSDRLSALVADLVRRQVAVIAGRGAGIFWPAALIGRVYPGRQPARLGGNHGDALANPAGRSCSERNRAGLRGELVGRHRRTEKHAC